MITLPHPSPAAPFTARAFLLVALVAGCGAHLQNEPAPAPPAVVPVLEGDVIGEAGEPIQGALVSASSHFDLEEPDPAYDERTDARGHFRFVRLPPGRYGVTATCAEHAAAYGGVIDVAASGGAARVVLHVGGPNAAVEGTVRDEKGAPLAGVRVLAPALSENENEVYVAHTDVRGHYLLRLPTKTGYFVVADARPRPRAYQRVEAASQVVDLHLGAVPAPRPDDGVIASWLRGHAMPLTGGRELDEAGARAFGAIVVRRRGRGSKTSPIQSKAALSSGSTLGATTAACSTTSSSWEAALPASLLRSPSAARASAFSSATRVRDAMPPRCTSTTS